MKSSLKLSWTHWFILCAITTMIAFIGFSLVSCKEPTENENPINTLTGTVTIDNMSPKAGDTLIADYTGNGTGYKTWQWLRDDAVISGASSNNYTAAATDVGKTLKARVSYANQSGNITSNATAAVAPSTLPTLTGTVTIDNTSPKVGDTLIAYYSGGNGSGAVTWQWLRNDTIISGVTHHNYTVTAADLNAALKAHVSYANQSGSITSVATAVVISATLPILTGTVTINNTAPKVGDTLMAVYSGGNGTGAETWHWLRNDEIIYGANGSIYTVVAADLGAVLKSSVHCENQSGSIISNATAAVIILPLTGTVTIDNTSPKIDDTLIAHYSGGNGSGSAAWHWLRNDTVISGATHNNYTVTAADLNATLKARVGYANQSGSITSGATAAVVPASLPAITGTVTINNTAPKVGDTLTANYSGGNGSGAVTWHWFRDDEIIYGANGSTYTVVVADVGTSLKASVHYADQSGSIISNATSAVIQTGSAKFAYYWVNEHDVLAATNGGAVTVSPGEVLTITAQGSGYTVIRWELNGALIPGTSASYNFSSWVKAKHNVTLIVEKGGRYYSAEFSITVE